MKTDYESFRIVLAMNLCSVVGSDKLNDVLKAVDIAMNDFDIQKKSMQLITTNGIPEAVKAYIASKAVSNASSGTLKQYRYKLINFFDTVRKSFADIQTNDTRMYLYNYKILHNATDRYIECIRVTLNAFFQWLVDNDYLQKNPCAKVEHIQFQEKKREPLSSYDLERFRWSAENIREKALVDFLFSTGCRVSECADVRLSDINWDKRSVRIRHGKGNKQRTVYFNAESELTLREYLKTRSDDTDALFVSMKAPHQQIKSHAIENIIAKISKRTGIHVYPHRLRHTFATSGIRGGMPLEKLQMLMGHTKPETTLIYAKLEQTDLQMEHQKVYA